jgi:hypothetical protein
MFRGQLTIRTLVHWLQVIICDYCLPEGVVDNNHNAMLMRNRSHFPNIYKRQRRVRRRLDPNELSIWTNKLDNVDFDAGTESNLDIVCKRYLGEVAVRSSIYIRD